MGAFEYRQALEIRDAFAREGVRYLFLGKSGAILLGFPDTTHTITRCRVHGDAKPEFAGAGVIKLFCGYLRAKGEA